MARITVIDFVFSERSQEKIWDHGIDIGQLYEVIANRYIVVRNRKDRTARYLVIGRDDHGECLVVPIMPTSDPAIWRPITAWPCKPAEAARLRQDRSIMDEPARYASPRPQEPLDDEERELMDPATWNWESSEEGIPAPTAGAVLEIRFTRDEIVRIEQTAIKGGTTIHGFIKQASLAAVDAEQSRAASSTAASRLASA